MQYSEIQKLASEGILSFTEIPLGGDCILITGGGVIMAGGQEVELDEVQTPIRGVIRDINARDVNGDTIRAGDRRGIFTHDVPMDKGNWILSEGVRYEVADARPIKPAGTVVAYRPILRRVAIHG